MLWKKALKKKDKVASFRKKAKSRKRTELVLDSGIRGTRNKPGDQGKFQSLSTLEDSGRLSSRVHKLVKAAVDLEIRKARDLNLPVSYTTLNGDIVVQRGHGQAVVIGHVKRMSTSQQLPKGAVLHAKKR